MRERMTARGIEPIGPDAERFGQMLRAKIEKWRRVVNDANLKSD